MAEPQATQSLFAYVDGVQTLLRHPNPSRDPRIVPDGAKP
ncbi:hypothetical protein MPEAHAMD_5802 [Methylobacterium frigidaeris]|uniref:Uncharacterized protein n=1 Tax=Methylobacterium frigidaeris TaxID=2038277 RepID=A0AA37HGG0_9HYPH|nr:hypothetical protein MPEAHAMD_5802 [Methylobacterium frigidaeris]